MGCRRFAIGRAHWALAGSNCCSRRCYCFRMNYRAFGTSAGTSVHAISASVSASVRIVVRSMPCTAIGNLSCKNETAIVGTVVPIAHMSSSNSRHRTFGIPNCKSSRHMTIGTPNCTNSLGRVSSSCCHTATPAGTPYCTRTGNNCSARACRNTSSNMFHNRRRRDLPARRMQPK
jgi:hypothetical protein